MIPRFFAAFCFCLLLAGSAFGALSTLTVTPDTVVGGLPAVGTLTLDAPAPAGGLVVNLQSNNKTVTVPANLTIAAGQTSATFTATSVTVTDQVLVTLTGVAGGITKTGSVTVNPVTLASFAASPSMVLQGASTTVTLQLTGPAPVGGLKIPVQSSAKEAPAPASITIPGGATGASFVVVTKPVTDAVTATFTADLGFVESTATLTVNPIGPAVILLNPSNPNGMSPSVGTVNLYGPAKGDMTISLTSSSRVATIPNSIKIPDGQSSATFPITTVPVGVLTPSTITAKYKNISRTTVLSVVAPTITTTVFDPPNVPGGNTATGTITLSFGAPPGGMVVLITSDMPTMTLPDAVHIPAGKTTATFKVKTAAIAVSKPAQIKSLLNGAGPTTPLTVTAPILVSLKPTAAKPAAATVAPKPPAPTPTTPAPTVAISATTPPAVPPPPPIYTTPNTVDFTLTISSVAPADGLDVALTSSVKSAELPAKVTVAGGRTSVRFKVKNLKVKAATQVVLTATVNGASITFNFTQS